MSRITIPILIGSGVAVLSAAFSLGFLIGTSGPWTNREITASDALANSPSPVPQTASAMLGAAPPLALPGADLASSPPPKGPSPVPPVKNPHASTDIARWAHQSFGFSFEYPYINHTVADFPDEENGNFVVIVSRDTPPKDEFQIVITPYPELPSAEEIREAFPGREVINIQRAKTLGAVGPAVTFTSRDDRQRTAYDVWFVHEGWLYQLSTYDQDRDLLMMALNSWRHAPVPTP